MNFINRQEELTFLRNYLASEPNALLFVYGPKSSGKSTLLNEVVQQLDLDTYAVNFLDLREMLIYDFKSFLDAFFPKTLAQKVKDVADGITVNIGFFGVNVDDESLLRQNPFKIMGDKLRAAKKRGKQPVLILDEIQLLRQIYLNGERYLIDELLNLFVRLTKVTHTAHVILATSESYFIDELYLSAKLPKTCEFYYVDHFSREAVQSWLKQEGCTESEISMVWEQVGGCPWEITEILSRRQQGIPVEIACAEHLTREYSRCFEFVYRLKPEQAQMFYAVIGRIVATGACLLSEITGKSIFIEVLQQAVSINLWFYKMDEQKIFANSQSLRRAFEKLLASA